jgi:hypothetical protein
MLHRKYKKHLAKKAGRESVYLRDFSAMDTSKRRSVARVLSISSSGKRESVHDLFASISTRQRTNKLPRSALSTAPALAPSSPSGGLNHNYPTESEFLSAPETQGGPILNQRTSLGNMQIHEAKRAPSFPQGIAKGAVVSTDRSSESVGGLSEGMGSKGHDDESDTSTTHTLRTIGSVHSSVKAPLAERLEAIEKKQDRLLAMLAQLVA